MQSQRTACSWAPIVSTCRIAVLAISIDAVWPLDKSGKPVLLVTDGVASTPLLAQCSHLHVIGRPFKLVALTLRSQETLVEGPLLRLTIGLHENQAVVQSPYLYVMHPHLFLESIVLLEILVL